MCLWWSKKRGKTGSGQRAFAMRQCFCIAGCHHLQWRQWPWWWLWLHFSAVKISIHFYSSGWKVWLFLKNYWMAHVNPRRALCSQTMRTRESTALCTGYDTMRRIAAERERWKEGELFGERIRREAATKTKSSDLFSCLLQHSRPTPPIRHSTHFTYIITIILKALESVRATQHPKVTVFSIIIIICRMWFVRKWQFLLRGSVVCLPLVASHLLSSNWRICMQEYWILNRLSTNNKRIYVRIKLMESKECRSARRGFSFFDDMQYSDSSSASIFQRFWCLFFVVVSSSKYLHWIP